MTTPYLMINQFHTVISYHSQARSLAFSSMCNSPKNLEVAMREETMRVKMTSSRDNTLSSKDTYEEKNHTRSTYFR